MTHQLTSVDAHSNPDATSDSEAMSSFQSAKNRFDSNTHANRASEAAALATMQVEAGADVQRVQISRCRVMKIRHIVDRRPDMASEEMVPIGFVVPGPVWPSPDQLKVAYGYAISS